MGGGNSVDGSGSEREGKGRVSEWLKEGAPEGSASLESLWVSMWVMEAGNVRFSHWNWLLRILGQSGSFFL